MSGTVPPPAHKSRGTMDQEDNCETSCFINGFTKPTTIYSFKGLAWLKDKEDEESGDNEGS